MSHTHQIAGIRSNIEFCNCGMVYDRPARLWRTKEEYDEQVERRREGRKVLGSPLDAQRATAYERGLGL